mgnify:CR=1 FL=1
MTNDTNITNDKDINANIAHDDHFNDSIVNEVILEDMKKNRIDHMKYLPDMEVLDSDIMDRVVAEMDAYDYDKYTGRCTRGALPRIPHIGGFQGSALACRTAIY